MGTDIIFSSVNFLDYSRYHGNITSMTSRYIPIFGLNSLMFILSFDDFFVFLCQIMEIVLPEILMWYKVTVVQTVLPIFCNLSFF